VHQLVVKKFSTLFDARCNHEVYILILPLRLHLYLHLRHSDFAVNLLGKQTAVFVTSPGSHLTHLSS